MDISEFVTFSKFVRLTIEDINDEIPQKTREITFKDVVYCCLYMNGSSCSYSLANINMCMNDIIDVSDTALKKRRNVFDYIYFKQITDTLLDFIYQDDTPRIVGVDGTYAPLSIELQEDGFKPSPKNTYCSCLISSLYDIERKMVINYNLFKEHNERAALMEQINYLKPNDILIMDRGYFSKKLLFDLNSKGIKVLFRMKTNSLLVTEMLDKGQTSMITTIIYDKEKIKFRIMTYKIDDKDYFLGTTIMNKTISYFKDLYWKRWRIETNFRESKYLLSLNNIQSKSINKVQQDIYSHNILFIICSYFKNQLEKLLPENKFINTTNLLYVIVSNLLYFMLYKKLTPSIKKTLIKH